MQTHDWLATDGGDSCDHSEKTNKTKNVHTKKRVFTFTVSQMLDGDPSGILCLFFRATAYPADERLDMPTKLVLLFFVYTSFGI